MSAPPALNAVIQAQKQQGQIQKELSRASGNDSQSDGDDKKDDKKQELSKPETVKQLVKHVGEGVMGAAKSITGGEQQPETMDSVSSRIITYSDSDDEGEKLKPRPAPELPPERPSKQQRQRPEHQNELGKKLGERLAGVGKWARGVGQAPLQLSTGQHGVRRVRRLWHEQGVPQLQQAKAGITVSFVLKLLALWLLRRKSKQVVRGLEFFTLAIPMAEALAHWRIPDVKWPQLPQQAAQAAQQLKLLGPPLLLLDCASLLHKAFRRSDSRQTSAEGLQQIRTRHRTPSRRTPRRLHFADQDGSSSPRTPSLGNLSEEPERRPRRSSSVGGTPRDKGTPRRRRRTPRKIDEEAPAAGAGSSSQDPPAAVEKKDEDVEN